RDAEAAEELDDLRQVVQLAPSRPEEDPADGEAGERRRQPREAVGDRVHEAANGERGVDDDVHERSFQAASISAAGRERGPGGGETLTRSFENTMSSVQSSATRSFFSKRGS